MASTPEVEPLCGAILTRGPYKGEPCAKVRHNGGPHRSANGLLNQAAAGRQWQKDHPENRRESYRKYRRSHPEQMRKDNLRRKYTITIGLYEAMAEWQGHACMICRRPRGARPLNVDHDHRCCPGEKSCGKCLRGLLDPTCNNWRVGTVELGYALPLPEVAAYLEFWQKAHAGELPNPWQEISASLPRSPSRS